MSVILSLCSNVIFPPQMLVLYLCSVPTAEVPGDAMSKCSGGIQGEGPASHHKTTRAKKHTT